MDDGQPTLLNRRASPFDRVLKTEIFRRGELSLFLATARARAALRRSFLSSRLSSFLFFPFFIFCYETREFGEHSERESEGEKEGKGGREKKRKEKQERGVFRA